MGVDEKLTKNAAEERYSPLSITEEASTSSEGCMAELNECDDLRSDAKVSVNCV